MKALRTALLFLSAMLFIAGCTSSNKFLSGTHLALGAYIPGTEGELYGIEIVNYLNGCMVRSSSNQTFTVDRTYCASNDFLFGMVKIRESTHTTVETKKR